MNYISIVSRKETSYRMHYMSCEAERATTVKGAINDYIIHTDITNMYAEVPGIEYEYWIFDDNVQKWVPAELTDPIKKGICIRRYIKGTSITTGATIVGDGEMTIGSLFDQVAEIDSRYAKNKGWNYVYLLLDDDGKIIRGIPDLLPDFILGKDQKCVRQPKLSGGGYKLSATDALDVIHIKPDYMFADKQLWFRQFKTNLDSRIVEMQAEAKRLRPSWKGNKFFHPNTGDYDTLCEQITLAKTIKKGLDQMPETTGCNIVDFDPTKPTTTWWRRWSGVVCELVGDAIGLYMDIASDMPQILEMTRDLQENHGWSSDRAFVYAIQQFLPMWVFDTVVVNIVQYLIMSSVVGIGAWVLSLGIAMLCNLIFGAIYVNWLTKQQTFQAHWQQDFVVNFHPQITFPAAANKSLAKYLSLRVGDSLAVVSNISNDGNLSFGETGTIHECDSCYWNLPETGAPFWLQTRSALAPADETLSEEDNAWSDWTGQWNELSGDAWSNSTAHPLVGTHNKYNGYHEWTGFYPWTWNGQQYYKSDPVIFTQELNLTKAMPVTEWHLQTQLASTYLDYTKYPVQEQVIILDGMRVVEANVSSFLSACTTNSINNTFFDVDEFYARLDNASYFSAWNLGEQILNQVNDELLFIEEDEFKAFETRTVDLASTDAPYGYWRASDTRLVPFTAEEKSSYALLQCADLAEFDSFMMTCGTKYIDQGWRAACPEWQYLSTQVIQDHFDDEETSYTQPNDWYSSGEGVFSFGPFIVFNGTNGDKGAAIIDGSETEETKVWRYFGPMVTGKVEWHLEIGDWLEDCPTLTLGLATGEDGENSPDTDVLTFSIERVNDNMGRITHRGYVSNPILLEDTEYVFRLEWNCFTGETRLFINNVEIASQPYPFVMGFEYTCVPNAFFIRTDVVGTNFFPPNNGYIMFDDFVLTLGGPVFGGYYAANAFSALKTNPAYQILIPNTWLARQAALYDVRDEVNFSLCNEIPLRTDIQAIPAWDGVLSFYPGEVADSAITFACAGLDNPGIKWHLDTPEGFSITPAEGIDDLEDLNSCPIQFSLGASQTMAGGIYAFALTITYAENDTIIFAETFPFRYAWNESVWLELYNLPGTMPFDTPVLWAQLGNNGNGPSWAEVVADGIPTPWLSSRGYYEAEFVTTFDETFASTPANWQLFDTAGNDISGASFQTAWQNVINDTYVNESYPAGNYGGDDYLPFACSPTIESYLAYEDQSGYLLDGGTGTMELQVAEVTGSLGFSAYDASAFIEGTGKNSAPSDTGVTYATRPELGKCYASYIASGAIGSITSFGVPAVAESIRIAYTGVDPGVKFWARERDGTDSGAGYTVQGPRVRFTVPKLYQGDGRIQVQSDAGQSIRLRSPSYLSQSITKGDIVRVTLAANTTHEVTMRFSFGGVIIALWTLVPAGNTIFGQQTVSVTFPGGLNSFDYIELFAMIDGTVREYLQVYDIRVDHPTVVPETSPLYAASFNENPIIEANSNALWTLSGTASPDIVLDWTEAVQDTYVNASDPRACYMQGGSLYISGGAHPTYSSLISRPAIPYLQENASIDLRLTVTGATGHNALFYASDFYDDSTTTYRHGPVVNGLCGNQTIVTGTNVFRLNSTSLHYAITAEDDWAEGTRFASLEDPIASNRPQFKVVVPKMWHGNGLAYMQTNTSETLTMRSPTFSNLDLCAGDWAFIRFATNGTSGATLNLLYQGAVKASIPLMISATQTSTMVWRYFNLTEGCPVDQVEIVADLTDGQYFAVDEFSLERANTYTYTNTSVYGFYNENIALGESVAYSSAMDFDDFSDWGNYAGIYSFSSEEEGSTPSGWATGGYVHFQVNDTFQGHNKVVNYSKYSDATYTYVRQYFTGVSSGNIEWWMYTTYNNPGVTISGSSEWILFNWIPGSTFYFYNKTTGAYQAKGTGPAHNAWTHFRVKFDLSANTYTLYLNGVEKVTAPTGSTAGNTVTYIGFYSPNAVCNYYLDAIDYSWASNYFPQRNMGYSVDNWRSYYDSSKPSQYVSYTVTPRLASHCNVLCINKTTGFSDIVSGISTSYFTPQASGEVEFWIYQPTGACNYWYSVSLSLGPLFQFSAAGYIQQIDTGWVATGLGSMSLDCWNHFRIAFNCTTDTFDLYLNNVQIGNDLGFYSDYDTVNSLRFEMGYSYMYTYYLDAIDYSWAPGYVQGRNQIGQFEGLFSFTQDSVGNSPRGWSVYDGFQFNVYADYAGHTQVVNAFDTNWGYTRNYFDSSQSAGSIEFWFNVANGMSSFYIGDLYNINVQNNQMWTWSVGGTSDFFYSSFTTGNWHHLRVTWDVPAAIGSIYLDGVLVKSNPNTYNLESYVNVGFMMFATSGGSYYVDAVDYSWVPGYTQGRNQFCTAFSTKTEVAGHRNVTILSPANLVSYKIGDVLAGGSVEWYLYMPALQSGMNRSAVNGIYPSFSAADLHGNLTFALSGTSGHASLHVCAGWLVAVNYTGGAGTNSISTPMTLAQLTTGWNHVRVSLGADGNYTVCVDGAFVGSCAVLNFSEPVDAITWTTFDVTLPAVAPSLTYYLDAIGSTGIAGYAAGANRNMTLQNGSSAYSLLLPGHWREFYVTVPRLSNSTAGSYELFARFADGISGQLIGTSTSTITVAPFYDTTFTNLSSLAVRQSSDSFEYILNLTNNGNIDQTYALETTIDPAAALTQFGWWDGSSWASIPSAQLALDPATSGELRLVVQAFDTNCIPFQITATSAGTVVALDALFDNDIAPTKAGSPTVQIEWGTCNHLSWTFEDNYIEGAAGSYVFDLDNGDYTQAGTWTSGNAINIDISDLIEEGIESLGVHICTIDVSDGHNNPTSDTALVSIYNVLPEVINQPGDQSSEWLTQGCTIEWTVIDYSAWFPSFNVTIDGAPAPGMTNLNWPATTGEYAFTIDYDSANLAVGDHYVSAWWYDGLGGSLSDTVVVHVLNTPLTFTSQAGDPTYVEYSNSGTLSWTFTDLSVSNGKYSVWVGSECVQAGDIIDQNGAEAGHQMAVNFVIDSGLSLALPLPYVYQVTLQIADGSGGANASAHTDLVVVNDDVPEFISIYAPSGNPPQFPFRSSTPQTLQWSFADTSVNGGTWELKVNDQQVRNVGDYNCTAAMSGVEALTNGVSVTNGGWSCNYPAKATLNTAGIAGHKKVIKIDKTTEEYIMLERSFAATNTLSAECWMYTTAAITGMNSWFTAGAESCKLAFGVYFSAGKFYRATDIGGIVNAVPLGLSYTANTWYHVRVEWSAQGASNYERIYINGALCYNGTAHIVSNAPSKVFICAYNTSSCFTTYVDGIAISAEENYAPWMSYYNGGVTEADHTWQKTTNKTVIVNAAAICNQYGPNTVNFTVFDGLGHSCTDLRTITVTNDNPDTNNPAAKRPRPSNWPTNPYEYGYNYGEAPTCSLTWDVSDATVGPGASYMIQRKFNAGAWQTVQTGGWAGSCSIVHALSSTGLAPGSYQFKMVVTDAVPGNPASDSSDITTLYVNEAPTINYHSASGYTSTVNTGYVKWTVSDNHSVSGRAYRILKSGEPVQGWTACSMGTITYTLAGTDPIPTASASGTIANGTYTIEVTDGYGMSASRTGPDSAVTVNAYQYAGDIGAWTLRHGSGWVSYDTAVISTNLNPDRWWPWGQQYNQNWWPSEVNAPFAYRSCPNTGSWWGSAYLSNYGAWSLNQLGGIVLYGGDTSSILMGFDTNAQCVDEYSMPYGGTHDSFGIGCDNTLLGKTIWVEVKGTQYRCGVVGGTQTLPVSGWYNIGFTPSGFGVFAKEWYTGVRDYTYWGWSQIRMGYGSF